MEAYQFEELRKLLEIQVRQNAKIIDLLMGEEQADEDAPEVEEEHTIITSGN